MGYMTLFQWLGVPPDASDADVEAAWTGVLEHHNFDRGAVPQQVRDAYRFLAIADNRTLYRDMLAAADSGDAQVVGPDQLHALTVACRLTGLRLLPDPTRPDMYFLLRPDQKDPWWNDLPDDKPRPRQPTLLDYVREYARRFLMLQLFRGTTPLQKVALLAVYVAVLAGATAAGKGLYALAATGAARALESPEERQARVKAEQQEAMAAAAAGLGHLTHAVGRVEAEFRRITGIEWARAREAGVARARELDLALIRHQSVRDAWDALLAARAPGCEGRSDGSPAL